MAMLEQNKKIETVEDPRAPRRILNAEEGEALLRRLAEPARKPTPAMVEAIRTRKRLLRDKALEKRRQDLSRTYVLLDTDEGKVLYEDYGFGNHPYGDGWLLLSIADVRGAPAKAVQL